MEIFSLLLICIMVGIALTYSGQILLYVTMVLGSFINDIKNKFKSTKTRKK